MSLSSSMAAIIRLCVVASLWFLTEAFYSPSGSAYPAGSRCERAADIVYLVDDSRSIWFKHFQQEISFVQRVTSRFNVSPYRTRFAALTFSSGVREIFSLGRWGTEYEVRHALGTIYQSNGGTTDTYKGIKYARDYIFQHSRAGVSRILIIITDGGSQERHRARREATLAKLAGIQIFVIGIGLYLEPYHLEELASEPTPKHLYSVSSFPNLLSVDWRVAQQVCLAASTYRAPYRSYHGGSRRASSVHVARAHHHNYPAVRTHRYGYPSVRTYNKYAPHSYPSYRPHKNNYLHGKYPLSRYPVGYSQPATLSRRYGGPVAPLPHVPHVSRSVGLVGQYGTPHSACLQKPAEVVFVVEQSSSVHVRKAVTFVSQVIEYFDIGHDKTRVSTVSYSETARVEYHLDEHYAKRELVDVTAGIPYIALGGSRVEVRRGLHMVREEVFTQDHGYRHDAARVVIMITEETWEEYEEIKEEAFALTSDGVHLFTIGVGPNVDFVQLRGVSSNPHEEYVFQVSDYSSIGAIKETLAQRTCLC